nr:hypothetical protein [Kibdelosporangium sp. MJ126-NF4]CEL13370.1 hypothetical protein [Kibdelosporangium sp. MJ126-NF4]CTQ99060.1 hypothetical protein [Kibdelosporangium sp. MJ126-NF4]
MDDKDFGAENAALDATIAASLDVEAALRRVKRKMAVAEFRTIIAVDVMGIAGPERTLVHLRTVHEGLFDMLREAFDASGIPWKQCYHEDRGDGAVILIPAEFPKVWLVDNWQQRLLAALRRYNAVHAPEARIRLRVVVHHGEVYQNRDGVVSHAVNLAFRILGASEAQTQQSATDAMLALIVSDDFYRDVVVDEPAADPATYRRIAVSVKQTQTVAWFRLPGVPDSALPWGLPQQPERPISTPLSELSDLVDELLGVPFMREQTGRALLIDLLPPEIGHTVPYHSVTRLHVYAILRTCLLHEGGMVALVDALRQLDGGGSTASRKLASFGRDSLGPRSNSGIWPK